MHDTAAIITTHPGRKAGSWVVSVSEAFTLPSIFTFQDKVAFLKGHEVVKHWIVDLSGVTYMDSAGLGCLINLYVSATRNEQSFGLVGANQRVQALLETAKVHTMFVNYPTLAAASDAFDRV